VRFAPEGYPFILVGLLAAAAAWAAVIGVGGAVLVAVAAIVSLLGLFTVWFFRDPVRSLPAGENIVVAPGEGRVVDIREVNEPSFLRSTARRISIFLSVFDVHVQRAPVTGTVEHREYKPGKYAVAWLEKASQDNEQASLGITTPQGRVLVRQIAGLVARRIVTDPSEGERVQRGERIGLIRFGSRVDLFLPLEWEVTCAVGDRARVGSTPLARLPVAVEA
jgi:phosphatidylserine decarboxylase